MNQPNRKIMETLLLLLITTLFITSTNTYILVSYLLPQVRELELYDQHNNDEPQPSEQIIDEIFDEVIFTEPEPEPEPVYDTFVITAYDNSYSNLTANGFNLTRLSREEAITVAADTAIFPLGTKLDIKFNHPYESYSGVYTARDTGRLIKGKKLDLYFGHLSDNQEMLNFGKREVLVRVVD